MLTPGQPSIVRGPNGWEWWLVYMANKAWKRNQHIDRIHFTGGRLYVDGITSPYSKGFHPVPAMPRHSGKSLDGVTVSDVCRPQSGTVSKHRRKVSKPASADEQGSRPRVAHRA